MKFRSPKESSQWKRASGLSALATTAVSVIFAMPTQAFQFEKGEVFGSLDTTLSYGLSWRVEDQDKDIIGPSKGGTALSENSDDGNVNYDRGLVSNVVKVTSEIELNYRNFGAFVRGTAFYDFENEDGERERTPLTDDALELVGSDAKLLDAYLSANFDVGELPTQIRAGEQVLSWGESTFIQNSINIINPIDVAAIRVPGAELREALLPEGMVWGSLGILENASLEAFYLYDWKETVIDPPGSYFSSNDFVGEGGERVMLGFGAVADDIPFGFDPTRPGIGSVVPRGRTEDADDDGQYGVALRMFVPPLNDTEFGFYFINYHSRLPIVNARTGTASYLDPTGSNFRDYAGTARYFISYPEDIKLFGFSFNTTLGQTGIALQGEISHRWDVPLQIDDIEILFAALGGLADTPTGSGFDALQAIGAPLQAGNQVGPLGFDEEVQGFIRRDVTQLQMTATKVFGNLFGANQVTVVGEAAITHVHDMPDKDELRLNGPGTFVSGNEALARFHGPLANGFFESSKHFADATSWGYRLLARATYNNAIGSVTLLPRIAFAHDVSGITPGPSVNFVEDRKAVTIGLGADYQSQWSADLSYTTFFGAGRYNLINDRDFIAANIKYAF